MIKHRDIILLLIILIIAGFLRLYQITTIPPGLYPDEAMNGNNALEALRTGDFKVYYPENNGREGLFINIQAIFLKIFGVNEPWVLRLPSAIFGILTVLGIYFLTKELFKDKILFYPKPRSPAERGEDDPPTGGHWSPACPAGRERSGLRENEILALLAALLLSTSFWHINFSRIGFRAIMAPLLLVWSLYFLLLAFRKLRSGSPFLLTTCYFLLSGIIFGLGFYTYIAYRVMPLLILAILFYYWRKSKKEGPEAEPRSTTSWLRGRQARYGASWQKKFLISTFLFLISIFIIALPIGIYYLQNPADFFGRTTEISVFSSQTPLKDLGVNILKTAAMFNFIGDWNWRHNYAGRPELFWPVGIIFLIGIVIGIKKIRGSTKHEAPNPKQISNSNDQNPKQFRVLNLKNLNLFRNYDLGFIILFLWLFLATLPVVVSNEGLPHALRAILMLPPAIILAAVGGVWFYEAILTKLRNITKIQKVFLFSIFYFLFSIFIFEAYHTYFVLWAKNPNTYGAFGADYAELGRKLNQLPRETPKYIVIEAPGVLVRGIPMPAQTVMFITDTYTPENQQIKNIRYILREQENSVPINSLKFYIK